MQRRIVAVLVLCGLLAIADAKLVATYLSGSDADTSPIPAATLTPTGAASSGAADSSSATTGPGDAHVEKVSIAALSATRAWRAASAIRCSPGVRAATFGYSADGGMHWTRKKVPMKTVSDLSSVGDQVVATGTDPSCKPAAYVLSATDEPRDAILAPSWVIDPIDPTALIASGNRVANGPCPGAVVDVAGSSPSDVVALCSDHSARQSRDKGMTWRPVGGASDAFSVAAVSAATFTASRATCGIAVGPLAGGDTARCVAGTKDWSGPGDMTIVDGTIWLATSDRALTTPLAASP